MAGVRNGLLGAPPKIWDSNSWIMEKHYYPLCRISRQVLGSKPPKCHFPKKGLVDKMNLDMEVKTCKFLGMGDQLVANADQKSCKIDVDP